MDSAKPLQPKLNKYQFASLLYHSKFDYPLTLEELSKWQGGKKISLKKGEVSRKKVLSKEYFFLRGKSKSIDLRLQREKYSQRKFKVATNAAKFLKNIPSIKFIGITGSLAMNNADRDSDIDLMIITKTNTLWTTRLVSLIFLKLFGFKLRRAGDRNEKDKLCLNLWLDESDLIWKERNEFIAHEILQIVPLVNKDNVFERFLEKNKWVLDYWPNVLRVKKVQKSVNPGSFINPFEKLAFKLQYLYMKKKITKEIVRSTRAQFHPSKVNY